MKMKNNFKKINELLKPFKKYFYLQLLLILLSQFIIVYTTVITGKILNFVALKDVNNLKLYFTLLFLLYLLGRALTFALSRLNMKHVFFNLAHYLRKKSLCSITTLNYKQIIDNHSAFNYAVVSKGEQSVASAVDIVITTILPYVGLVIISFTTIAYYTPSLAVYIFVALCIFIYWEIAYLKVFAPMMDEYNKSYDINNKRFAEAYTHLGTVKLLAVANKYTEKKLMLELPIIKNNIKTWLVNIKHFTIRNLSIDIVEILILVYVVYLYFMDVINIGVIYIVFSVVNKLFINLTSLIKTARQLPLKYIEVTKYLDLVYKKPEFSESGIRDFDIRGIQIKNLDFKYEGVKENTLENVSINIDNQSTLAIVGKSGSGKSTLIKVLLRAYDYTNGIIKIDNYDLKEIDSETLRQKVGYVSQDTDILDDTFYNNITLSLDEEKGESIEIKNIVEATNLVDVQNRFEGKGLGEKGVKISGGEKQRIGIARALIKKPELLILDEPTSALDGINGEQIINKIHRLYNKTIILTITHKHEVAIMSDIIYVMDMGRIVQHGKRDEVIKSEIYKKLME